MSKRNKENPTIYSFKWKFIRTLQIRAANEEMSCKLKTHKTNAKYLLLRIETMFWYIGIRKIEPNLKIKNNIFFKQILYLSNLIIISKISIIITSGVTKRSKLNRFKDQYLVQGIRANGKLDQNKRF
jgi:hypothetical protein